MDSDTLIRPALGDEVPVGALYDARNDTFYPVPSEDLPENIIDIKPIGKSAARLSKATTIRDKIAALGITPELGASILAGLAPAEVYAPYLNYRNGYRPNTAQASLHYIIMTQEEELRPYTKSNRNYGLTPDKPTPTHLVISITYGAEFLVTAHQAASSHDDFAHKHARLDFLFESLRAIALDKTSQPLVSTTERASPNQEGNIFEDCDIAIFGNLLPPSALPVTPYPSPRAFIDDLHSYLKETNGGKGKPIQYTLLPLMPNLPRYLSLVENHTANQPDVKYLERFFRLLDDWADARQRCLRYASLHEKNKNTVVTPDHLTALWSRAGCGQTAEDLFRKKFGEILEGFRTLHKDEGPEESHYFDKWLGFAENNELGPKGVLSEMIPPDAVDFQDLQKNVKDKTITYAAFRETILQRI